MSLALGTRLGPFEITAQIGIGGMGEVYRATDTSLKRAVAVKVLPGPIASDADRLARFQREAEVLASLNHPNIAQVHGLEKSDGGTALVMELVEGPTLADRIAEGPFPLDEALHVAKQIADALEAAHERGIIHRDLKPANIKLRPDGTVKVLDFGLAKAMNPTSAVSSSHSLSPTLTTPAMTQMGMVVGTAAYMSPEQARGLALDKRTDIWALGCVLFEMLTGSRAFPGDTVSDVTAAVLRSQPDYSVLPPPNSRLRSLLERSMEKDPKRRWRDVGDLRLEMEVIGDATSFDEPRSAVSRIGSRERVFWMVALLVTATIVALAARLSRRAPEDGSATRPGVVQFGLTLPPGTSLYAGGWLVPFSLSPDGKWLAYTATSDGGRSRLWLRAFDTNGAQPIAGSEGAVSPFWSPDSDWLGFQAGGMLHRVRIPGGSPETITRIKGYTGGVVTAAWGDDAILFSGADGTILRVSPQGGQPEPVTTLDAAAQERIHFSPQFLSNRRDFLYVATGTSVHLVRQRVDGGARTTVAQLPASTTIRYTRGYLFQVEDSVLWAQRFDEDAGRLIGERRRVAAGIPTAGPGAAPFSVSPSGVAYWTQSLVQQASELKWFDRTGNATTAVAPRAVYDGFDVSRDGLRLVSAEVEEDGFRLWVQDLASASRFPLRPGLPATVPVWAPDNRHVVFMSGGALWYLDVDRPDTRPVELTAPSRNQLAQDWSVSGDQLVYENWSAENGIDLVTLDMNTKRVTRLPWNTTANEFAGRLSSDNRWLLYVTDQTGRPEVWITAYPSGESRRQLSSAGGTHPAWRKDGREVYFISPDNQLVAMSLDFEASGVKAGSSANLFRMPRTVDVLAGSHNMYQPASNGQRFLVSVKPALMDAPPVNIILNWRQLLSPQ